MKLGIHHTKGTFSDRWISYCEQKKIPYKIVNCYESDIIQQLDDCDALLWHHQQTNYKDVLLAKNLLFSLEQTGKVVFPDFNMGWHFDDKVAQKYLLESIDAPLVPSYVFYDKKSALEWVAKTTFPKVFKLKGGSGSGNVKLARTKTDAKKFINRAFGAGFSQIDAWGGLKDRYRKVKEGKKTLKHFINGLGRLVIPTEYDKMHGREKGYAYFQDFIPNNPSDYRLKIANGRVWGLQRMVRKNDFRASGSGNYILDNNKIPKAMINIVFDLSKTLNITSAAFDFVLHKGKPLIVEISYGYGLEEVELKNGYWTSDLEEHNEYFDPCHWMLEEVIEKLKN